MKRFFFWKRDKAGQGRLTEASTPSDPNEASGLLTGDPEQDRQSIEVLLESIAEVTSNIELDRVLGDIVARSLEITQAERAFVLLGSDPSKLKVRIGRDNTGKDLGSDVDFSRSVVRRSIEEGRAGQYQVQSSQEALELGQSVFDLKLRTVMCAPLVSKGRSIGVVYVDSRAARREFSSRDLALFEALSSQLAIALENARLHEDSLAKARLQKDVEIAQKIQEHLLPTLPDSGGKLDIGVHFSPASQASGDTYDLMPLDGERLAVLIGDVTGHGVGAALLTHAAQAAVRSYLELLNDLGEVVTRLNNRLVASVETGMFMSAILLIVDGTQRTLTYVNAGHPPLLLVRDGEVTEYEKTGMVLGVVEEQEYEVRGPIALQAGDCLFLHTDGIEEAMNEQREVFGLDRIKDYIVGHNAEASQQMLQGLEAARAAHAGSVGQDDDVTMVAIKVGA